MDGAGIIGRFDLHANERQQPRAARFWGELAAIGEVHISYDSIIIQRGGTNRPLVRLWSEHILYAGTAILSMAT